MGSVTWDTDGIAGEDESFENKWEGEESRPGQVGSCVKPTELLNLVRPPSSPQLICNHGRYSPENCNVWHDGLTCRGHTRMAAFWRFLLSLLRNLFCDLPLMHQRGPVAAEVYLVAETVRPFNDSLNRAVFEPSVAQINPDTVAHCDYDSVVLGCLLLHSTRASSRQMAKASGGNSDTGFLLRGILTGMTAHSLGKQRCRLIDLINCLYRNDVR
jgi:hypothetical protein